MKDVTERRPGQETWSGDMVVIDCPLRLAQQSRKAIHLVRHMGDIEHA